MGDSLLRLRAALADRYAIERELGQGGMATVYFARDLKLGRAVALKVLRPELAASLGGERFLREIEIAAKLAHPHILALHDCGEADGLLYYTMPFVEGETLRDRLTREKQLPLEDALRITREVADALSYAHSRGLVHRDIKPENILFQAGHAVVSDFGIARAVSAAGGAHLTETGLAIGTPAYMSPEQAAGSQDVDGRSDLYSLGCVLYEMLGGDPPFYASTPQAVLAKKLSEAVPRISVVRDAVPAGIEQALSKALARTPADRFATAADFATALTETEARGHRGTGAQGAPRARWLVAAGIAVLAIAVGVAVLARRPAQAPARPDPLASNDSVVAVLPFRLVSTDTASTLRDLALGLPELFAMKITGEFGPRIAHPPTVQRLWRDAGGTLASPLDTAGELRVASAIGAGRLIRGTLVATDTSVVLTGEVVAARGGEVRVRQTSVEGRWEDRFALVDQLAWRLLAQDQGIPVERLPRLARFKPRAIQAYLAGNRARDMESMSGFYRAALAADSTLVVAALMVYNAGERDEDSAYARYAWEHRDELTPYWRAYLLPLAGWRFGATRTVAERIEQWRALVRAGGNVWGDLGQTLAQDGPLAGVPNWEVEAREELETAVRLSPKNIWAWWRLLELAFLQEDTALVRQRLDRYVALKPAGFLGAWIPSYRWRFAMLRGDSAEAERLLAAASVDSGVMPYDAVAVGRGLATADRVVAAMDDRFFSVQAGLYSRWRGRYRDWRRSGALFKPTQPPIAQAAWRVHDALFLDAPRDSAVAAQAAFLERVAEGRVSSPASTPAQRAQARCWSALWRVMHGDTAAAPRAVRLLEREVAWPAFSAGCAAFVTLYLTEARGGDVRAALLRLDAVVRDGPLPAGYGALPFPPLEGAENLTLARRLVQVGDTARALAASRRRVQLRSHEDLCLALPEFLREEGRLAALTGDRAGAIKVYTRYLGLREDPDYAPWRAVRDSVRRELAQLVGGPK